MQNKHLAFLLKRRTNFAFTKNLFQIKDVYRLMARLCAGSLIALTLKILGRHSDICPKHERSFFNDTKPLRLKEVL